MSKNQELGTHTNQRCISSMSDTNNSQPFKIGVIGLGIMGSSFSRNFLASGFTVFGNDINQANVEKFVQHGGIASASASDVVKHSDIVITSLPSVDSFHAVMSGQNGILSTAKENLIVVECSTLAIEDKTLAHNKLAEAGIVLLDCPVSGTGAQAVTRDLSIYVSGNKSAYEKCEAVFNSMARKTFFVGEFGNGSKMKFVANVLVHIHNVASAEAMVLAMKAGLDPATTVDVISNGAGNSRIFELRAPMMVNDDYSAATMKMDVWQKDIHVISEFAKTLGCPTPLFNAGTVIYEKAMEQGMEKLDTGSVCRVLERMANVQRSE